MVLDKEAFLLTAFRKVQKTRKGLKHSRIFKKNSVYETWKRLEGLHLHEYFLVFILLM